MTCQSKRELHNCTAWRIFPCVSRDTRCSPGLVESHCGCSLGFVWVTVIIVVCGVGFCYLGFLKCKINSQIGVGRAASLVRLLSTLNLGTKEERKMA